MQLIWKVLRVVTLGAILIGVPLGIAASFVVEHFARYWIALILPLMGIVSVAFWYLIFGTGAIGLRARRFGWFALIVIVLGTGFRLSFRYDGSTSGASLPRYVLRWKSSESEVLPGFSGNEAPALPKPVATEPVEGAVDSPQLYGPNRDATWSADAITGSFDWENHPPEELWRQPIGQGWSGFAVVGRRALTMEQHGDQEVVTCYDLLTGELLWTHRDDARYYLSSVSGAKEMAGDGPRAVPTVSGGRVYSYGATGILNCLSLETGEALWQREVIEDLGKRLPEWGKSTSPLIIEDLGILVVSGVENGGPTLLAFQMETGEPAWQYEGHGTSYSSPSLVTLHGERQLVSVNGHDVTGHLPATGEELWRFDWSGKFPKVAQPVSVGDNRLLVTASYGAGSYLIQIGKGEAPGTWSASEVWKTTRLKTKFSSAVIRDGFAYGLDEGRLACVDLKDGSRVWKDGKYGFGQNLLIGDHLLVQAEEGDVVLVEATPEAFRETARIKALDSMTWNPPTFAGRYLLVRNDREVVCFRLAAK
ncbi:MAG: PQQ-binding-like beta-propeller repeat protein [Verrucomicrobiae bacterium]|nr:PQQ-binding-like beta-propeller repeat protein [Verrucomicrobiae bacterium]